jgi:hypothetical protein
MNSEQRKTLIEEISPIGREGIEVEIERGATAEIGREVIVGIGKGVTEIIAGIERNLKIERKARVLK